MNISRIAAELELKEMLNDILMADESFILGSFKCQSWLNENYSRFIELFRAACPGEEKPQFCIKWRNADGYPGWFLAFTLGPDCTAKAMYTMTKEQLMTRSWRDRRPRRVERDLTQGVFIVNLKKAILTTLENGSQPLHPMVLARLPGSGNQTEFEKMITRLFLR